jgi:probable HAF family extracellular repeat protein
MPCSGAINNRGDVVGASLVADGTIHQWLWTRESGIHDVGNFPGAIATVFPCCNIINDLRQLAGFAIDPSGNSHAILWQDGVWMDLNELIPHGSRWSLQAAESINDAGQITGFGLISGNVHAFLATPCDDEEGRENCESRDRFTGTGEISKDQKP